MTKISLAANVTGAAVILALAAAVPTVSAQPSHDHKVTICHRTNSVKNAYVQITVSKSAVDGQGHNDHTHHTGPVATSEAVAQNLKDQKIKWGDIIPPFNGFGGQNWTAEGQAIYHNDCEFVSQPGQPGQPGHPGQPGSTPVVLGGQVTVKPSGGVGAGAGAASGLGATLAAAGALVSLGAGLRRLSN